MKIARHSKIIELINKYDIVTQEELAEKLNDEGFNVTQATVSRDIRELKLTKMAVDNGKQKYVIIQNAEGWISEKYIRVLRDGFLSIDHAENLVVIRTVSGMAMAVAAAIDGMQWGEILGCIAGDDTIFCAIKTKEEAMIIMDKIKRMVSNQ